MNSTNEVFNRIDKAMEMAKSMPADGLEIHSARDIKPEPIQWLWNGWLAQGKFHLLAGLPGQGKTTIAMSMCAIVSGGGSWPDGSPCESGNVLIWSSEDDPNDTLVPRLIAAGNLDRCHFIQGVRENGELRSFDPARDISKIEEKIEHMGGVKLLVLDPVVTVVAGDSHKNNEVRRALQPLVDLAQRHDMAILGLTHLSKGNAGQDPSLRVNGSIGFTAVARTLFIAQKIPTGDGTEQGIFTKAKANTSSSSGAFKYTIEPVSIETNIETTRINWGQRIDGDARTLLMDSSEDSRDGSGNELLDMLRAELENGPMPVNDVLQSLESCGFSKDQIKRASVKLGVDKAKQGMEGPWMWSLPVNPLDEVF